MSSFGMSNEDINSICSLSKWDIPKDLIGNNFPIQIKSVKEGPVIGMADARSFVSNNDSFRLIVGLWRQKNKIVKEFYEIVDFFISYNIFNKKIKKDLNIKDVENFHNQIQINCFGKDEYREASKYAKVFKEKVKCDTLITLNPKIIISTTQRRLQCSISIKDIEKIEGIKKSKYKIGSAFNNLYLPFYIFGGSREFNKKKNK